MTDFLEVLFEDNHCLVVNKPAGMLTMGDHTGDLSLVDRARDYLKLKYQKPGNVFVGVVHRLDRPVSGVVLFARTSKAASRLSEQFRDRTVDKVYIAAVQGVVSPTSGVLRHRLLKDRTRNVVGIVDQTDSEGQDCVLAYRRLEKRGSLTLVEIRPQTGRSHQIRVQLSERGWPIVGDRKYGSQIGLRGAIGLHASSLTFLHPTTRNPTTVSAPLPESWDCFQNQ